MKPPGPVPTQIRSDVVPGRSGVGQHLLEQRLQRLGVARAVGRIVVALELAVRR